jgi:hypothetical protein
MYARLLATLCLLPVSASLARAESALPAGTALEVYLKGEDASTPDVLTAMDRELGTVMQSAGFHVTRRSLSNPPSTSGAENLVIVELRGVCMPQFAATAVVPLSSTARLASSSMVDGKILPFSWIDCVALNRFLAPAGSSQSKAEQDNLFGRSMARLLAHEFYHVLAQADDHALSGIAKARFNIGDLLTDHLDFETVALERLRRPSPTQTFDDASIGGR